MQIRLKRWPVYVPQTTVLALNPASAYPRPNDRRHVIPTPSSMVANNRMPDGSGVAAAVKVTLLPDEIG